MDDLVGGIAIPANKLRKLLESISDDSSENRQLEQAKRRGEPLSRAEKIAALKEVAATFPSTPPLYQFGDLLEERPRAGQFKLDKDGHRFPIMFVRYLDFSNHADRSLVDHMDRQANFSRIDCMIAVLLPNDDHTVCLTFWPADSTLLKRIEEA